MFQVSSLPLYHMGLEGGRRRQKICSERRKDRKRSRRNSKHERDTPPTLAGSEDRGGARVEGKLCPPENGQVKESNPHLEPPESIAA